MKVFGSISKIVSILFKKDGQDITFRPNQATTYSAARDIQLPAGDAAHVLISRNSTDTLTNKSIDADTNTITNIDNNEIKAAAGIVYSKLSLTNSIVNADIAAAAAIAYSKLALTGSIVNADINASAAIAYSKLNLSGSIVNADVNASAAIAYSKLNLSASIVNADIASGANIDAAKLGTGVVSNTEFNYLDGVTSAIQTQLDAKVLKAGDTMTGDLVMANQKGIKFREATGGGTNIVYMRAPAALAGDLDLILPIDAGTSGYVLSTDGSGNLSWVSNASTSSFKTTWALADGAAKTITHNLGSLDVIVQIYDLSNNQTIEVDTVIRTDTNTLDLTASEAPNASGWRVIILQA